MAARELCELYKLVVSNVRGGRLFGAPEERLHAKLDRPLSTVITQHSGTAAVRF